MPPFYLVRRWPAGTRMPGDAGSRLAPAYRASDEKVWYTCSADLGLLRSLRRDARTRLNRLGLRENHARYQEGVMDEPHNFNLDQMMERIRSNVHGQRQELEAGPAPPIQRPQGDYLEQQGDVGT